MHVTSTDVSPRRSFGPLRARPWLPDVLGVVVVCLIVLIGYYEVPFAGKTFDGSSQVVGVQGCGTQSGACTPHSPEDPRVDYFASSWALDPWSQVVHRELSAGDVPLWNPYQGIGMPLAGNMQSSVFDPMLLAVHLHPTPLVQDLTSLLALLLIGVAAYAAARALRLSPIAATVAGSVYGLSGWFFLYVNNHWFMTYLYLPLIVACVEWTLRSTRRLPVVLLAAAMTATVLAGMPEAMFMSFVAASAYSLSRLFIGPRAQSRGSGAVRLVVGAGIGIALAAPVLLLFVQYLPRSFNTHANLGAQPPATDPFSSLLNWAMPKISPDTLSDFAQTRNWVGAGAIVLGVVAVSSARARKKFIVWPLVITGAIPLVQVYGGALVGWTRHIPLWSQAFWPNFGTPVLALMLALLAATGIQAVLGGVVEVKGFAVGLGALAVLAVVCIATSGAGLALRHRVSVRGGWPLAVAVVVALIVTIVVVRGRAAGLLAAGIVVIEVALLAPHGFYSPRANPYPSRSWINYVAAHTAADGARVMSTDDGVLFPDTAGVYGLSDPRMLDAMYPDRYWKYLQTFIVGGLIDRWYGTGPSENAPNVASNPMFDILGVRYLLFNQSLGTGPQPGWGDQYRLVFQGGGVKVYENTHAGPRAFVVPEVHAVADVSAAARFLEHGEPSHFPDGPVQLTVKDPRQVAAIEADPSDAPKQRTCNAPMTSDARIVSYSVTSVKIAVDSSCDGLLVLGDEYFPGWKATVNGDDARIFATDVALRGVFVRAGQSTVEFHYKPAPFKVGLVVALLAVGAVLFLLVPGAWLAIERRRRRARPEPEAASLGSGA